MLINTSIIHWDSFLLSYRIRFQQHNFRYLDIFQNHVYSVGAVLLWLSKANSPSREREEMLNNLINEMMKTEPEERPSLEIVSKVKNESYVKDGIYKLMLYSNL